MEPPLTESHREWRYNEMAELVAVGRSTNPVPVTWSLGDGPFAVDDLLAAGRALDRAASEGLPVDVGQAGEVVDTLSAYVASLPAEQQQTTARRLVEALNDKPRYEATARRRR